MGAKNSTERTLKNLEKILGEDEDLIKKNKKEKKDDKKDKKNKDDKDNKDDNKSLLGKQSVKGGCKQCALMNK